MDANISLRLPNPALLPDYIAALETGWSPNTTRDVSAEQLAAIHSNPTAFIAEFQEREGRTITLPGGAVIPRLPGPVFWIWDGAFCGQINLRYQPGTPDLPPFVSGHLGYAIVPWKRRQGIATQALRLLLPVAASRGLRRVLVTCDEDNLASRRVIERAGGAFARSETTAEHGRKLLFWLATD